MKVSYFVKYYYRRKRKKKLLLAFAGLILVMLLFIPVRLAIAIKQAPQPQAFFILGGDPAREKFIAELAEWYPSLEIWVSSPPEPHKTLETFRAFNVPKTKLNIDMSAVDTVTNFTTVVAKFKQRQLQHLFLITSDYHMPRAKAIATLILGSQGIAFSPLAVPSPHHTQESIFRILRDIARSLLWIVSHIGTSL